MMVKASLQKRFLWVVIPLAVCIAVFVFYSQNLVNKTTKQSVQSSAQIRAVERSIYEIRTTLQTLQRMVYQYTVVSFKDSAINDKNIDEQTDTLNKQVKAFLAGDLHKANWSIAGKDEQTSFTSLVLNLNATSTKLKSHLNDYKHVVADAHLRFPGMSILESELFPANDAFIQANDLALQEIDSETADPVANKLTPVLMSLRYAWAQQISWFRLFVANRSGLFGTPEKTMSANLVNREIYWERVGKDLGYLEELNKKHELGFQTGEAVQLMREAYTKYEENFVKAVKIYTSDEWRTDHRFLDDILRPEFETAIAIIDDINLLVRAKSVETVQYSYATARQVTLLIWAVGIVVIILVISGYVGFEYMVRQPLIQVSAALDAEASGRQFSPLPESGVRETSIVLDAFNNMRQQVYSRQARLESILNNAAEGIITIDEEGVIETFNTTAERLFSYSQEEVLGKNINKLLAKESQAGHDKLFQVFESGRTECSFKHETQLKGQRKDGSQFPLSIKISSMLVSGRRLYTAMLDDVTERIEMIKDLRNLAEHDSLTKLFNRYYFLQELDRVVERSVRGAEVNAALLYIDLDNFKYVNDSMGHLAGDKLLIEIASILDKRARKSDLIARLGGDEFAVILYDVDKYVAVAAAESFREHLQEYNFIHEGRVADVGCSVGISMIDANLSREDVLSRADFSCHVAKREGRNKIHLYTEFDQKSFDNISDDMGWTRRIKEALEMDRFMFVMQPIMDCASNEINHYEVLLRMLDDDGKFIMPQGFLSPAERFGLMTDIDKWVVRHALELLIYEQKKNREIHLAINLSAHSFANDSLFDFITSQIQQTGIEPSSLTFEVTETVAMADIGMAATFLDKICSLGCYTALDDFGVGHSSFAYLKDLPVDYVKIDGSFVKDISSNELNKAIVKSMHDVAHAMGKQTVAEFVGSEKVSDILRGMGVDYLQGYYIGEPVVPEFEKQRIRLSQTAQKFSA